MDVLSKLVFHRSKKFQPPPRRNRSYSLPENIYIPRIPQVILSESEDEITEEDEEDLESESEDDIEEESEEICHHPGCTRNNENRPMLLCKECDNNIHQRSEYNGHLVLDLPKRKIHKERQARFSHTNSTPNLPNQPMSSVDMEEVDNDEGFDAGDGCNMDTDCHGNISKEMSPEMNSDTVKKLKRKKVVKGKRRHTTGARSHSASDIFTPSGTNSEDEGSHDHRYSYHGSIDENTLADVPGARRPSVSNQQALQRLGKGTINHETFTVKIRRSNNIEDDIEIVAAEKNVSLRESIVPILERRGMDIEGINVFVEASNTPLPLTCETFLLGGTTMYIKQKDGETNLPAGTQSLSKATGSKFAAGNKSQSAKSKSGGSLRRRGINLSIDDSSFPMALTTSISPQGTLREADTRKQKQPSKLTTLFSPLNKDKEKQDQLNELLNQYSATGLPPFPSLMQIGQLQYDDNTFHIESHWKAIVGNSQDLTKRQQDQQEAIWELLNTELQFIRSIRVISDLFLCVLLNLQNEVLLNEIDTDKLFNNIVEISQVNGEFWSQHLNKVLEESRNTAAPLNPSLMKDGFQKYNDLFQPYTVYCAKQKMCTDYMKSQYTDNELFKTFVIWAEAQKQCNRLKLTDLLVKPMQRLTKYSLLLQAILRKTDNETQRRDVLEMIGSVDRFVHHVNSTLRQQHEEEKLQAIVDKIEPYDAVDAPNDECLKLIQPYNSNFNLTAPMPGCDASHTRALVMQSPLKMKEYQNRMDVECLLFTDLMLICKASKRMDKYKIVKPPMRVDRIITHELKDKGSFLLIYVNEYHVPVSSFTFHGDQNAVLIWTTHIKKAQDLFREARMSTSSTEKPTFPQSEIITEEVIGYTPLINSENNEVLPLLQLTRCASDDPEISQMGQQGQGEVTTSPPINRSRSWNEMALRNSDSGVNYQQQQTQHQGQGHSIKSSHVPMYTDSTSSKSLPSANSASDLERLAPSNSSADGNSANHINHNSHVQYSSSDPLVFGQYVIGDERLQQQGHMSISTGTSESDMSMLPEFIDESMKSKLYQRRASRTEKRYYTADAIQELNKSQNRDNSIYKRFSDRTPEKHGHGVLKTKAMSSDSILSFRSSSGVSSTGSLHLSPDGNIHEVDSDLEGMDSDFDMKIPFNVNEDEIGEMGEYINNSNTGSKSTPDIVSLMQDLNTRDMKDGITSVDLPICEDPKLRLSHAQLLRMKKQLLLSSNVEASEV